MKTTKSFRISIGLALLALSTMIGPAQATNIDFTNPAFIAAAGPTSIPIGHAEFCATRPNECVMQISVTDAIPLDNARWQQLLKVNANANSSIVPVTDAQLYQTEEFWTYPRGYGDCEDYVLEKRRTLVSLGWPESSLLITVVRQANGEGHAVLMVRTDRGDLVLDNQDGLIKLWNETPYRFLKRQSQSHAGHWVELVDTRPSNQIASL